MPSQTPLRILFLAANPKDTDPLRLDEEIRTIEERLRLSKHASLFEIKQAWAVRVKDLQDALLRHDPHIVHFSGHGSDFGEIILENVQGESHPVPPMALSDLFSLLKGSSIRGIVLNSCGSLSQAEAIVGHIDFVVGMSEDIGDETAIAFASSFYQGLGYGKSVSTAFELGRNQIHLEGLAEEDLPKLLVRKELDPSGIVLADTTSQPTASAASITRFEQSKIKYLYGSKHNSTEVPVNSFFVPTDDPNNPKEIRATSFAMLTITRNGESRTKLLRIDSIEFSVAHVPFVEWIRRRAIYPQNVVLPIRYSASVTPKSDRVKSAAHARRKRRPHRRHDYLGQ